MNKFCTVLILLTIFCLFSCAKKNLFVLQKKVNSTLKIGFVGNADSKWTTSHPAQLATMIQEPLLELAIVKGQLQLTPRLLEKWEFTSPNSMRLTLKKEIVWEGGIESDATRLINAWKELLLAYPDNPNASLLFCIANAKNFAEHRTPFATVGIQKEGSHLINLKLNSSCPNFPFLLTHLSLSPRLNYPWSLTKENLLPKRLDSIGDWLIESHWPKNNVKLELSNRRLEKGGTFKYDKLHFNFFDEWKEAFQLFEDNQLDIVTGNNILIPHSLPPTVSFPTTKVVVLVFNSYRRPFQNIKAREMLIQSVDKEETLKMVAPEFDNATRLLPFLNGDIKKVEFSIAASKQKQQEVKFSNLLLTVSKDPKLLEVAKNLTAQWKKNLGLDVEITSEAQDNPMMTLQYFQPDFYKKALGLEEWVNFSSHDFLTPVLSSLASESVEPFKLYEERLVKMEKWIIEEEKWVFPLLSKRNAAFMKNGISTIEYNPLRDSYNFN